MSADAMQWRVAILAAFIRSVRIQRFKQFNVRR